MQINLHCKVAAMSVKEPETTFPLPAATRTRCQVWSICGLKHRHRHL